jgi:hypothetical protein
VQRWAWAILRVTLSHAPAVSDNWTGMAVSMACPHSGRLGRSYRRGGVAAVDSKWHELRLESLTQTGDCVDLPSTLDNVPCTNSGGVSTVHAQSYNLLGYHRHSRQS